MSFLCTSANAEEMKMVKLKFKHILIHRNEDGTEGDLQPIPEDAEEEWEYGGEFANSFMEE